MTQYTIYCSPEQTRKALELGAPIDHNSSQFDSDCTDNIELLSNGLYAIIPTAEQMLGWLEEKGIIFGVSRWINGDASIYFKEDRRKSFFRVRKSYKEALIAAIDEALDYLIQSVQTNEKKTGHVQHNHRSGSGQRTGRGGCAAHSDKEGGGV